jgi:membrane associated rhomboid family serine protease
MTMDDRVPAANPGGTFGADAGAFGLATPGGEVTKVPVCPRHPNAVSYVMCQRCGQPTCPACQRPAAVGVQCVDCVQHQKKLAPRTTNVFGGRTTTGRPLVTMSIIGLCVLMFAAQLLTGGELTRQLLFAPALGVIQPWRFLTAAFLHSTSPMHIAFNMWALWVVGRLLEPALGRARFITLCLLTALAGSVGYLLLAGNPAVPTSGWWQPVVGASGMVFGLFGALIPVVNRLGGNPRTIYSTLAINAVLGFTLPGIAWQAHLGGFLAGLALGYAYSKAPRDRQKLIAWAAPAALAVLMIAAAAARYAAAGWFGVR